MATRVHYTRRALMRIDQIKRREFITLLGGAAAWPFAARAQQAARVPTIGFMGSGTPETQGLWLAAFMQRLLELGWIDGRTVAYQIRWADGRIERFTEFAAEFARPVGSGLVASSLHIIRSPRRRGRANYQAWRGRVF